MTRVHILTKGFASPNGRAFLFPLFVHRKRLEASGLHFSCFEAASAAVTDCDALIIDSRFYSHRWARDFDAALGEIESYAGQVPRLLWFDISDSTGWLQSQVLPHVTRYCKAQLLKDRAAYLEPIYGNRIFADHYHRTQNVEDDEPVWSRPVQEPELLAKLHVSWNSGLADYSRWGPLRMALRQRVPLASLLRFPDRFTPPDQPRSLGFAARFGTRYPRATVSWQRRRIAELVEGRVPTRKLDRKGYLDEMRSARVVVSPFGFGEITLKDFEAFLCGAAVLKPDMSHMETWPDLFVSDETILTHGWDLEDFDTVLQSALDDDARRLEIAERGQDAYRHHVASNAGYDAFCDRFCHLVEGTPIQ